MVVVQELLFGGDSLDFVVVDDDEEEDDVVVDREGALTLRLVCNCEGRILEVADIVLLLVTQR